MKIFYLFLAGYISLYLGKLICSFMAITIEPEMNDLLSKWYEGNKNIYIIYYYI